METKSVTRTYGDKDFSHSGAKYSHLRIREASGRRCDEIRARVYGWDMHACDFVKQIDRVPSQHISRTTKDTVLPPPLSQNGGEFSI